MLRRWTLALMLGTTAPAAGALALAVPDRAEAYEQSDLRDALATLDAEVAALEDVVERLKVEHRAGTIEIAVPARKSWDLGVKALIDARAQVAGGDLIGGLQAAHEARGRLREGVTLTFSSVRYQQSVQDAVGERMKAWVDVVAPRFEAVRRIARDTGDVALLARWEQAQGYYEEARKQSGYRRWVQAYEVLYLACGTVDDVLIKVLAAEQDRTAGVEDNVLGPGQQRRAR